MPALYNKTVMAPLPCEAEFNTFELHFIRKIRDAVEGLSPSQVISDTEYWGEQRVSDVLDRRAAIIKDHRLVVLVPEQWQRLKEVMLSNVPNYLSSKLMDRVQAEQVEYQHAMSLFDDLSARDSEADKEMAAILLEYIVIKRKYINSLRQIRRDILCIQKQANQLLFLLQPYRRSSYDNDEDDKEETINNGEVGDK